MKMAGRKKGAAKQDQESAQGSFRSLPTQRKENWFVKSLKRKLILSLKLIWWEKAMLVRNSRGGGKQETRAGRQARWVSSAEGVMLNVVKQSCPKKARFNVRP